MAIFVDDTNFLTVWSPLHISHNRLISVVDHLLEPVILVHHPDNDETGLIGGSELLVLVVPLDNLNLARVTLKMLIDGELTTALAFTRLKLEDLKETLITTNSDVALLLVPSNLVHWHVDANLQCKFKFLTFFDKYANI